jgi:TonB-linked SusC/RagA family outer membrane protein
MKINLLKLLIMGSKRLFYAFFVQIMAMQFLLATPSNSQNLEDIAISINVESRSFKEVLDQIEQKTTFRFTYNQSISNVKKSFSLSFAESNLREVLEYLSETAGFEFKRVNNTIYVALNPTVSSPKKITVSPVQDFINESVPQITGIIQDGNGEPIPGASVLVKGTTIGTVTDLSGSFVLDVSDGAILVVSFIGYATKEVVVGSQTALTITLEDESQALGEVVVTAFGLERKKESLVYSVTEVRGEEFTQARETNIANALTGKIAGVNATSMASGPGSSSRVVIRGNGSLNGNNQPLYVVNGMPISNNPTTILDQANGATTDLGDGIQSINPDDIESISVLKGGAAAALYGSQAANGVILITTKQGIRGKKGMGVEINSNLTVGTINIFPDYQYEYGQGSLGVRPQNQGQAISTGRLSFGERMDGQPYVQFDGVMRPYSPVHVKDNIRNFYRSSTNLVNTVAISGGNDGVIYRFSMSDLRSQAIVHGSSFSRQTANLNLKTFLSDKLSFDTQIQYNYESGVNRPGVGYVGTNSAWGVYLLANTVDIRSLAPGYDPLTGQETEWQHVNQATNPYFARDRMRNSDYRNRVISQAALTYDILPNLFLKADFMRDFNSWNGEDYYPKGTAFRPLGTYRSISDEQSRTNARLILNYNTDFLEHFNFAAMGGANLERDNGFSTSLVGSEFIIPDWISHANLAILVPDKGLVRSGTNSVFASTDFNYKEAIYLSLTARQDWFSTLRTGNNRIFYPSIGGNVILSSLLKLPRSIEFAKLRSSWAEVGSATVAPYAINQLFGFRQGGHLGVPVQTSSTAISNPDLRPLTSTTFEVGLDASFLEGRLGIDLTYYRRMNTDDIVPTGIAPSSGATSILLNVGKIRNRGVELLITGVPVRSGNFTWNTSYNLGYNENRVISLAEGQATGASSLLGKDLSTRFGRSYMYNEEGIRVYNSRSRYAMLGPIQALGVGVPPYTMGFENTFSYKRVSLNVLLDGKFGNHFFSQNKQYMWRFGLLKETLPGREDGLTYSGVDEKGDAFTQTWPARFMSTYYNNDGQYAENFMIDGSFVKLRNLIVNYNIPASSVKALGLSTAQISLVARNLAILYRNSDHFDPEQGFDPNSNNQNFAGVMLPRTREIGINIKVSF